MSIDESVESVVVDTCEGRWAGCVGNGTFDLTAGSLSSSDKLMRSTAH